MSTHTPSPVDVRDTAEAVGVGCVVNPSPQPPPPGGEGVPAQHNLPTTGSRQPESAPSRGSSPPFPLREGGPGGLGGSGLRRRTLLLALPLLAVAGVVVWYVFLRSPPDDLAAMQGDWVLKGADGRDRVVVRISGDLWTYHAGDEERGRLRIALDPTAAPREIDLTALEPDGRPRTFTRGAVGVEMRELGVYELRGDEFRIAKAPAWHGGTRPRALSEPQTPALTLVRVR